MGINAVHYRIKIDTTKPVIYDEHPENGTNTNDSTPQIYAHYFDTGSGINVSTAVMSVDQTKITPDIVNLTTILYNSHHLAKGWHNIQVNVSDNLSHLASFNWTFNITNQPPTAGLIQCNNNSVWTSCDNIQYQDTLAQVRAVCQDTDNNLINATFNFTNIQDNNVYFNANSTSNNGTMWTYNNSDILIEDSGDFNLTVTCIDVQGETDTNSTIWFIPFGTLEAYIITGDTNVTRYGFFNFSAGVRCVGGECGNVNGTLDPF